MMNKYFLLNLWFLVYFVSPGWFDSSTERCFCKVSTVCGWQRQVHVCVPVIAEASHRPSVDSWFAWLNRKF